MLYKCTNTLIYLIFLNGFFCKIHLFTLQLQCRIGSYNNINNNIIVPSVVGMS